MRGSRSVAWLLFPAGLVLAASFGAVAVGRAAPGSSSTVRAGRGFSVAMPVPGWAPGGSPFDPASQRAADIAALQSNPAGECGPNSLLLYSVPATGGAPARADEGLLAWTTLAGQEAIGRGWRVRAMTSGYPAPGLPLARALAGAAAKRFPDNAIAVADVVERNRSLAVRSAPGVVRELVAAYDRCPQRTILIAGYSEGATVLRYVIPRLQPHVAGRVAGTDLIGDPTADRRVDSTITHMTRPTIGIDTAVARLRAPKGKQVVQPRYARLVAGVRQWCGRNDLVCDALYGRSLVPHGRYPWAAIGGNAVDGLANVMPYSLLGLEASFVVASPPDATPFDPDRGTCGPVARSIIAGSYVVDSKLTITESVPSAFGWLIDSVQRIEAVWHGDSLTWGGAVHLWARKPAGAPRWPDINSSGMNLVFVALPPTTLPTCKPPLTTEDSPLGPAYPTVVFQEGVYGTGRGPAFQGCAYLSITGSDPITVRVLITAAVAITEPWTCRGGNVVRQ